MFGEFGINAIQIGKTVIPVEQPKSAPFIKGHGDTIKLGDVFFEKIIYLDTNKTYSEEMPRCLDAVSLNEHDPWYRVKTPDSMPVGNYEGVGWKRIFTLADKETTDKFNFAMQFWGLYIRIYVKFFPEQKPKATLIPACWVVWVGDLMKAFCDYHGPFGKLKRKNIVRWVKTGLFTDFKMKSKVAIPENFPVSLKG